MKKSEVVFLKSRKLKEISDEMIGMDDRICNCASRVADMILEGAGDKAAGGKAKKGGAPKSRRSDKKRKSGQG